MVQETISQANFIKGKKDLISNIQIKECGAKVYILLKMQVIVLDIRIVMINKILSKECFLLWLILAG